MNDLDRILKEYDYAFPDRSIAKRPASPRDSARLLVYRRKERIVEWDTFANIAEYLPKDAVVVFNRTKVLPANISVTKPTGGKAKLLYTGTEGEHIRVLSNRKLDIGGRLSVTDRIGFTVVGNEGKYWLLRPDFAIGKLTDVLERYGETPIPPYIKDSPLTEPELRKEYQTVFAREKGSVAAPTASLHFTDRLIGKMRKKGIAVQFVTLHVGLGTFAPLTEEQLSSGSLHKERYAIDARTAAFLNRAKQEGRPIIAVGTTVVRTLESSAKGGMLHALTGETNMFIREGYRFSFVDGMVTNFHVPRSSLMMLVAAFISRRELLALYRKAIAKGFRLFSFGDGMLIY